MADYITMCSHCGYREFIVTETREWYGEADDNGALHCTGYGDDVKNIHCVRCGAPYSSESFANFELNNI
jgi:hypothetical protein